MVLKYDDVAWERNGCGDKIILGRGAFGTVYAGRLRGQPVAIKSEELGPGEEEAWMKAVRLHVCASSPHIVAVHGIIVDSYDGKVTHSSVMERLAGTMTARLLTPGSAHHDADMALRLHLLADVAGGLTYLHEASVIHADVKPDNVLLTTVTRWSPFPIAKLADFGSSVLRLVGSKTRETLMGERGTLVYMDPGLLDGSASLRIASDAYSFGIMAWQVLTGRAPYEVEMLAAAPATALDADRLLKAHVCGPHGKRPPVSALVKRGVPPSVVAVLESCWAPAQGARPTMTEVQCVLLGAARAARAAEPNSPLVYDWNDQMVLRGHNNNVWSLALLPGGQLASGDYGGTVRLWDAARGGEATAVLEGHRGHVYALAALADGHRLAVGVTGGFFGTRGCIVLWDMSGVPPTHRATVDCGSSVWSLAVLRDSRLVAGCGDGNVRLVEMGIDAGTDAATLKGHTGVVAALAELPDGPLASGSGDKTVRLWDVSARVCVATLAGHTDGVHALAVLVDGRLASGSGDKSVRLWDVAARACGGVLEGHTNDVRALAALTDGRLASGSDDKTIRVWDTRPAATAAAGAGTTGAATAAGGGATRATPVVVLEGHSHWVSALQPLPGGRLASGSRDKTVRLWRLPPL